MQFINEYVISRDAVLSIHTLFIKSFFIPPPPPPPQFPPNYSVTCTLIFSYQCYSGSVYTFAFGNDCDLGMMQAIASHGKGVCYFIDSLEKVI